MPGPLLCSGLAILRLTFLAPAGAECPLGPVGLSVSTRGLSPDRPFGRGPAQRSGAPRGRGRRRGAGGGETAGLGGAAVAALSPRSPFGRRVPGVAAAGGQPLAEGRWEGRRWGRLRVRAPGTRTPGSRPRSPAAPPRPEDSPRDPLPQPPGRRCGDSRGRAAMAPAAPASAPRGPVARETAGSAGLVTSRGDAISARGPHSPG